MRINEAEAGLVHRPTIEEWQDMTKELLLLVGEECAAWVIEDVVSDWDVSDLDDLDTLTFEFEEVFRLRSLCCAAWDAALNIASERLAKAESRDRLAETKSR